MILIIALICFGAVSFGLFGLVGPHWFLLIAGTIGVVVCVLLEIGKERHKPPSQSRHLS